MLLSPSLTLSLTRHEAKSKILITCLGHECKDENWERRRAKCLAEVENLMLSTLVHSNTRHVLLCTRMITSGGTAEIAVVDKNRYQWMLVSKYPRYLLTSQTDNLVLPDHKALALF
jgi:hypothetical protein